MQSFKKEVVATIKTKTNAHNVKETARVNAGLNKSVRQPFVPIQSAQSSRFNRRNQLRNEKSSLKYS